jgi:acyl homoserine lactone synthase
MHFRYGLRTSSGTVDMNILIGGLEALGQKRARALFRLRHRTFKVRLDWDVSSVAGEERDIFDDEHAVYVVVDDGRDELKGCLRLIPSKRPYMLESVFSSLLDGQEAPRHHDVWELSRFAFEIGTLRTNGWGFSEHALDLVRGAIEFARVREINRYLLVTSVAVERMMLRRGLHCYRLGLPRRIGQISSVALVLEVDAITIQALGLGEIAGAAAVFMPGRRSLVAAAVGRSAAGVAVPHGSYRALRAPTVRRLGRDFAWCQRLYGQPRADRPLNSAFLGCRS